MLMVLCLSIISCNKDGNRVSKDLKLKEQEEKDWKELDSLKTLFFGSPDDRRAYGQGSFWHKRNYEDSIYKNRLRLADNFLKNYQDSEYYFDVLKFYFNYLFEPRFLKDSISD